ncbi:MAG: hypothetical protein O4859_18930 [Trichodesmium sp. St18_bin1]|nr:hypothetical protein [Trichodesmium sp. St18_bin1]
MKKTLSLLCSFFLILALAFSLFPGDASAKTFPCDQPVGTDTIEYGGTWDSQFEARGALYWFEVQSTCSNEEWVAETQNYVNDLTFEDQGGSNSVVTFYTPDNPANVRINSSCRQPLNLTYCPYNPPV